MNRRVIGQCRAEEDFKEEGLGQDANPFDRNTDKEAWSGYMWRMAQLWNDDFNQFMAENKRARA